MGENIDEGLVAILHLRAISLRVASNSGFTVALPASKVKSRRNADDDAVADPKHVEAYARGLRAQFAVDSAI